MEKLSLSKMTSEIGKGYLGMDGEGQEPQSKEPTSIAELKAQWMVAVAQRNVLLMSVERVFVSLEKLDASGDVGGWISDEVKQLRTAIAETKGGGA